MRKIVVIRNANIGDLLETLLVSSVGSILVIRFFLKITSYPQLGNGAFHIAHMLWGGFFMLIAIVMLLSFLGIYVRQVAAVIGGIGFGTFIDELGKFITSDNNYFFQPTVAIIYFVFLILFFLFRYIERHNVLSEKEYLMNALELLGEGVQNDMDGEEKKTFLSFLANANVSKTHSMFTKHLLALSKDIEEVKATHPSFPVQLAKNSYEHFNAFLRSRLMRRIILFFFIMNAFFAVLSVLIILIATVTKAPYRVDIPQHYIGVAYGELISTILAAMFTVAGVATLKFSRLQAYRLFKYSILISILVTQFFVFYREQFSAIFGLLFNAVILLTLNYMISLERSKREPAFTKVSAGEGGEDI